MSKYPIELVNADKEQTLSAAILKSSYRMAYADCFAAALAMQLKAPLVTGDPEFHQLQKKLAIQWITA
ncbi:MAG: PIN domain-containing protein [Desulfobacterales bacterium]|nr:PIN domain-containing protein [Desulfobacterales bacterium]